MNVLVRIQEALETAASVFQDYTPGRIDAERKRGGDPVTEADRAVNQALHGLLPRNDEGWLSEETVDDKSRLDRRRVWVVDPLDGTREFVSGIPEWCVSVGFVENGFPIAGGIHNPATHETIVGAQGLGVRYNGERSQMSGRTSLEGGLVLASRSEVNRGEWSVFDDASFEVRPMGSVAYKLALVAAGKADATWTIVPKNEWDVAAGAALVLAAGGSVYEPEGRLPVFNRESTLLRGLVGNPKSLDAAVRDQIAFALSAAR